MSGPPVARGAAIVAPGAEWDQLMRRVVAAAPEAFSREGRPLNLVQGIWCEPGHPVPVLSPVDGRRLSFLPVLEPDAARRAVRAAADESHRWRQIDLDARRERVAECLTEIEGHRALLACLLVWETGRPHRQGLAEIDRLLDGVRWYLDGIEGMLARRHALGLISNITSGNHPMGQLLHSLLIQMLAGNAVIAKTPAHGGLLSLTLGAAIARRSGLPVSLVSGSRAGLSDALVCDEAVAAVSFVGGGAGGRAVAAALERRGRPYTVEMRGINAYGVWGFSDWPLLRGQLRAGFESAKQHSTAYTRFVVERALLSDFLDAYLDVARGLVVGHPLLVSHPNDPPPDVDFGPRSSSARAEELRGRYQDALSAGAVLLHRGVVDPDRFLPGQDVSAYFRPAALLGVPRSCDLYHHEPSGPVDTIVVVDGPGELVAEMNASQGALVASIACDDPALAARLAGGLRAFKVGINRTCSRGDRDESFGGLGESWRGAFTGGVDAVRFATAGDEGRSGPGNHPGRVTLPDHHPRVLA